MTTAAIPQKHETHYGLMRSLQWTIIFLSFGLLLCAPLSVLLMEAFKTENGQYAGFGQVISYITNPALLNSLFHSINIALWTTALSLAGGFSYAFALARTCVKSKRLLLGIAMLPLFAPTMMHGISLIYLFGRQGIVTTGFFGMWPGIDIQLYGPVGIVLAETIYTFPQVVLLLYIALRQADQGLYDAAKTMGIDSVGRLWSITLPSVRMALVSAAMVAFTLSFTDYGAPKLVGGQYNVLATDVYKQVVGQQNFGLGAVAGILLMTPAIIAFVLDQAASRKASFHLHAKARPLQIKPHRARDIVFNLYAWLAAAGIILLFIMMVIASFTPVWPYTLGFTFDHFTFNSYTGDGLTVFWNSLVLSVWTAILGTVFAFVFAYWLQSRPGSSVFYRAGHLLSLLPMAVPGLVIGISYVLFFSQPELSVFGWIMPNVLYGLYGTMAIMIVSTILHFFSVSYMTAKTALSKLDGECVAAARTLGLTKRDTFFFYIVPSCVPALLEMLMYFFVNSMVTISAAIFLYTPETKTAAISIVSLDDAGNIESAAAMGLLIVLVNMAVRLVYEQILRYIKKHKKGWMNS
ncbi:putative 2-aminoethylphosphonate ABC transporter permease subunit [Domibacillus sp. DTU_2020_1001157_1_SI_ALB_TIR_016]|uniref:putative 2-aminoethylphosphonate ABC transporter permease subunit n=1 Tax=Domibacillus sp. DTU_2020_1001157_1_SI_ALB_TIR_016 TaxID=3077789 RepID=UPI0028E4E8D0|nr:putative 2-aminoethylphosphonate ABC transporter permease subunit [Domibacillus sp. DTU_2020_1001157_1_SI_ALB_TIR_016]WNS78481.1 putative 2-aminoethylphosphonate ABC transporter permease subunit [Domibacillus sp. DTU_2020_1001157_1_SI_ALB_TIR_016]